MLIGISGHARAGKDTIAEAFTRAGYRRISLADKLKEVARDLFGWDGEKDEEGRKLLILLGAKMREISSDVWIRYVMRNLKAGENVVIPDIRYKNEASWIKAHKGVLIRVVRPMLKELSEGWRRDKSEIDLDFWEDWDYIIVEDDFKKLQEKALDVRHKIFQKRYGKLLVKAEEVLVSEIAKELREGI